MKNNNHENFWFLIAFIFWIFFAYFTISFNPKKNDLNIRQPDEFEMRGGNYWK